MSARARAAATLAVLTAALPAAPAALADDHPVERSLQGVRCIPAAVREVARTGPTTVYEATCAGAANRAVTLVCTARGCLADEHSRHAGAEEDGE